MSKAAIDSLYDGAHHKCIFPGGPMPQSYRRKIFSLLMLVVTLAFVSNIDPVHAAFPASITYQGSLKEKGVPANGTYTMQFKIYDATNSSPKWTGTQSVEIKEGLYRIELSPTTVDWGNSDYYLETC